MPLSCLIIHIKDPVSWVISQHIQVFWLCFLVACERALHFSFLSTELDTDGTRCHDCTGSSLLPHSIPNSNPNALDHECQCCASCQQGLLLVWWRISSGFLWKHCLHSVTGFALEGPLWCGTAFHDWMNAIGRVYAPGVSHYWLKEDKEFPDCEAQCRAL